jgi:hypothetical protein
MSIVTAVSPGPAPTAHARPGGPCAQRVAVIDLVATSQHRVDHRHCLVTDVRTTRLRAKVDVGIEQVAQAQMLGEGGGLDQTGISDQTRIIEDHIESVEGVR